MILVNPKGKEVEFSDEKAEKILSIPLKVRQGWKKKKEKKAKPVESKEEKQEPKKRGRKPKVNE